MTSIGKVFAWEVLDSRGNPTVACEVTLNGGARGTGIVPAGASTGSHEAKELRDGGKRFGGRGVRRAVKNVNDVIGPAVIGLDATDRSGVDRVLEGFEELGANAMLGVSIATWLSAARAAAQPLYRLLDPRPPLLPMPMVNIISGGAHAAGGVDLQDFLVVPVGAGSFSEAIEWVWRVRRAVAEAVAERGYSPSLVADEGGLGPPLRSNLEAVEMLTTGIERARLTPGAEVAIAIDVAANRLAYDHGYHLASEGRKLAPADWLAEMASWCSQFPIISIEDPFAEDDWGSWREMTNSLDLQLVGDDLFATNLSRLERGIADGVANAVLVKPNQAGTLSRAEAVLRRARDAGYATIVSARSGDTEDSWLSDLAVGWRAGQIKVGSLTRSERTAKWNRLLRIEAQGGSGGIAAPPGTNSARQKLRSPRDNPGGSVGSWEAEFSR